jgi:hypothetical protein
MSQPNQNKGLVPLLRPNIIVTEDEYAANQHKIAQIRHLAASMEQNNERAHQKYIVQQELQKRVEEGERAQSVPFFAFCAGLSLSDVFDCRQLLVSMNNSQ